MADHSTAPADGRGGGRRALGPAMTTFVVVDVILVLTFLVVAAMSLGGRDGTPDAAQTSPAVQETPEPETEPDQTAPAEPQDAQSVTAFQMPSGNIYCEMTETSAQCTILTFSYTPPDPPAGCAGTVGHLLNITAGQEGTMPCLDGDPPPPPDGTPVLEYGQASTVGEMTCQSSPNGVYCQHDPTRNGFSVARAGYRFF
jgi:hypothetical protein